MQVPRWLGGEHWPIWFARARAVLWLVLGVVSIPLGWASSVALVWMASVYANVESGIATGQASDNRELVERLDAHERLLREILRRLDGWSPGEGQVPEQQEQRAGDQAVEGDSGECVSANLA